MKKSLMGVLWLLAAAGVAGAQEENTQAVRTNAAASFELTSAAKGEASAAPRLDHGGHEHDGDVFHERVVCVRRGYCQSAA